VFDFVNPSSGYGRGGIEDNTQIFMPENITVNLAPLQVCIVQATMRWMREDRRHCRRSDPRASRRGSISRWFQLPAGKQGGIIGPPSRIRRAIRRVERDGPKDGVRGAEVNLVRGTRICVAGVRTWPDPEAQSHRY
jgi:hypothetical protein